MCLFCKIANKEISAEVVYEDSDVVAFRDINPQAPTHVLVIPREHVDGAAAVEDASMWARLMNAATKVADRLGEGGYRLVINQGEEAGQTVPHLHVHIFAGRAMGWPPG